ncbi:NAD(P)/FAD-dependent oxidoreductase [Antrihabitans cavernicola]|uniref:NADH:ubiquinone reductase (non-electrogenic) n=1 Tax=Antrihabitans cavernicola TaxID=2495913 RepID=A0A5A7S888_9NOCA|nr:NAD(P)/FAD-dependent oxidoreductase [Spelaeibacter cavernicola]KAA0021419.1 NAD(P)/FAD-dependent oxidoreductase [Spelaeibacter cavernicola]
MDATEVVIVGSGFGGLAAAKQLSKSDIPYVLISSTPEHLFQPLLYQVATGVLEAHEIAPNIAKVLRRRDEADVRVGNVVDVDADRRVVTYAADGVKHCVQYKHLIAATGASQAYFGHDEFQEHSYALKTIDDAKKLRTQIKSVFAQASSTGDQELRRKLLSFVVVGAGATGVEVAGQIKELAKRYFHQEVSVHLVEGADEVLPPFGGRLSEYSKQSLERIGVDVQLETFVTAMDADGVTVKSKDGTSRDIAAATVVWSAGVQAGGFARVLADATGCETDRAGRLLINRDLTVGGYANIFAVGDMTSLLGYPGQSPVAMQEARHAADIIRRKKNPGARFTYWDKGSMSVITRFSAVAKVNKWIQFKGFVAWLAWLGVHLFYLVGFRNRFAAVASWLVAFIGTKRPGFAELDDKAGRASDSYDERLAS